MPTQPIGYVDPPAGTKLALGQAIFLVPPDDAQLGVVALGAPLADPRLVNNLTTPTTRTAAEGIVTAGRGQAPTAATSQPLRGLNCT